MRYQASGEDLTPLQSFNITSLLPPSWFNVMFLHTGRDEPLASSGRFSFSSQPGLSPFHQSEKSKPFGPDYYLPPLPRVISMPHPIRLSSQTVAESLYYFSEVSFWICLFNLGCLWTVTHFLFFCFLLLLSGFLLLRRTLWSPLFPRNLSKMRIYRNFLLLELRQSRTGLQQTSW